MDLKGRRLTPRGFLRGGPAKDGRRRGLGGFKLRGQEAPAYHVLELKVNALTSIADITLVSGCYQLRNDRAALGRAFSAKGRAATGPNGGTTATGRDGAPDSPARFFARGGGGLYFGVSQGSTV